MTAIIRDPDGHVMNGQYMDHHGRETCCMCDRRADAVWVAGPSIHVCASCALANLPKLIADAVSGRHMGARSTSIFHSCEKEVLLNFWRGAAGALQVAAEARTRMTVKTGGDIEGDRNDEDDES